MKSKNLIKFEIQEVIHQSNFSVKTLIEILEFIKSKKS